MTNEEIKKGISEKLGEIDVLINQYEDGRDQLLLFLLLRRAIDDQINVFYEANTDAFEKNLNQNE